MLTDILTFGLRTYPSFLSGRTRNVSCLFTFVGLLAFSIGALSRVNSFKISGGKTIAGLEKKLDNPSLYPINRKSREKIKVAVSSPVKYENRLTSRDFKVDDCFVVTRFSLCTHRTYSVLSQSLLAIKPQGTRGE